MPISRKEGLKPVAVGALDELEEFEEFEEFDELDELDEFEEFSLVTRLFILSPFTILAVQQV